MESTPPQASTADEVSRALCVVDEINYLGNLLRKQQQEFTTQTEKVVSLEDKVSALEEELVSTKQETVCSKQKYSTLDEQYQEHVAETSRLRAEQQTSHAALAEYRQRIERSDAVSHELLNQLQLKDAYTAEQKMQTDSQLSQLSELRRQIEQLQAQSNYTPAHTRRVKGRPVQSPVKTEPEDVLKLEDGIKSEAVVRIPEDIIDLTVTEDQTRWKRARKLGPIVQVDHGTGDLEAYPFTRAMLKICFGGGDMATIVTPSHHSKTQLAIKHSIDTFICPKRTMNPWLPRAPGEHGFMFYGLGQDEGTYKNESAIVCSLFVGIQKNRVALQYYGRYHMQRTAGLTLEEWNGLREEERVEYVKLTADKTKDKGRSLNAIRRSYDTGQERVPCVALKCLSFDDELFEVLVTQAIPSVPALKRTGSTSSQEFARTKRSRHSETNFQDIVSGSSAGPSTLSAPP